MVSTQPASTGRALVLVGAALGTGRWLAEHLLPHAEWTSVTLVDSKTTKTSLASQSWRLGAAGPVVFGESIETPDGDILVVEGTTQPLELPDGPAVIWFALPPQVLPQAVVETIPLMHQDTIVVVSASPLGDALNVARSAAEGRPVHGVHPLFDATVPSIAGQILYAVPDPAAPADGRDGVPAWLESAVARSGGILKVGSADDHDRAMELVQSLAHRTLVDFADAVTSSGLDLEHDIWEARTPLFETLFGLAVRVLDSRAGTIDPAELARVRDRFPGSLYETIRDTAATAVTAAQSKRLALASHRRNGRVIGLRVLGDRRVRIGRIVDLTSTSVTLEELMIGPAGRAALLDGPGIHNAGKLGITGRPRRTTFGLGHVDPVTGGDLEAVLDEQLAHIRRDVRFLVPESVAGDGVLQVVKVTRGLKDCSLADEVVRTGQRSVVIRMSIRADLDPTATIEALQAQIAAAYRWPAGLSRAASSAVERIVYLGPAGTFSEDAAASAAHALGAHGARLDALGSFEEVLGALGPGTVGVLPVSSSASGLVSRSIEAIMGADLTAGGMVDVAVRFDAYARADMEPETLKGAIVYSHPQGLAQCRAFIRRFSLQPVEAESTAAALRLAAAATVPAIALAGGGKGEELGLSVIEREVDDLSGSITRFLVVGDAEAFGDFASGSKPTMREVWVGSSIADALPLIGGGAFDELLSDASGRWLLITSRTDRDPATIPVGARRLGQVPWSPRTPVVRAS